jgi:hypothetical protein
MVDSSSSRAHKQQGQLFLIFQELIFARFNLESWQAMNTHVAAHSTYKIILIFIL